MSRKSVLVISSLILLAVFCLAVWWAHLSTFGLGPIDVATLGNFTLEPERFLLPQYRCSNWRSPCRSSKAGWTHLLSFQARHRAGTTSTVHDRT
jgi:hypothetical protein